MTLQLQNQGQTTFSRPGGKKRGLSLFMVYA